MNKYLRCGFAALALVSLCCLTACSGNPTVNKSGGTRNQKPSKHFKTAGHLNYQYNPGVILPLRNGKILALGSERYISKEEKFFEAADGKRYGNVYGMTELFDPTTGQTQVLTRMPFQFAEPLTIVPDRRQMQAIELPDGRIFMVGRFAENRPKSAASPNSPMPCPKGQKFYYLPFYSHVGGLPQQLKSIAPCNEPNMFGLIYDWRNQTFEIVNSPDSIPPRWMVTMNPLPDGKILILGGSISLKEAYESWEYFPETRALIFDPKTKQLSEAGNLKHARYGHECIPLSSTEFLLIGGWGVSESEAKQKDCAMYNSDGSCEYYEQRNRTREVEKFDLKTGKSKVVGHTLTGRFDFSALLLPNKTVFIQGSPVRHLLGFRASELYDLKTGKTIYIGEKRIPEKMNSSPPEFLVPYFFFGEGIWYRAILKEDIILIVGTNQAFIYKWRDLTDQNALKRQHFPDTLVTPYRDNFHLVKTPNGRVFVIGGLAFDDMTGIGIRGQQPAHLIEEFIYPATVKAKGD